MLPRKLALILPLLCVALHFFSDSHLPSSMNHSQGALYFRFVFALFYLFSGLNTSHIMNYSIFAVISVSTSSLKKFNTAACTPWQINQNSNHGRQLFFKGDDIFVMHCIKMISDCDGVDFAH